MYVHTKACIQLFIAALPVISKNWKQPKYPSIGEWIHKLWRIHTMEYQSVMKKTELWIHADIWMDVKIIILK